MVVIVWQLDLQIPVQSVPITTNPCVRDTAENFFGGQISTARETEQKISLEVKSQRD
jgi:hypothetical protein